MSDYHLKLVPQARFDPESVTITSPEYRIECGSDSIKALDLLANRPVTREFLVDHFRDDHIQDLLAVLDEHGLLERVVFLDDKPLVTCRPRSMHFCLISVPASDISFRLSRFASARVEHGLTIWSSPLADAELILHHPQAAVMLHSLAAGATPACLDVPKALGKAFLTMAFNTGLLATEQENEPPLSLWEPHDLAFHARSRVGGHREPAGGLYPFHGKLEPEPLSKPETNPFIALAKPKKEILKKNFRKVWFQRRSVRTYGGAPIDRDDLGALLHACYQVQNQGEDKGMVVSQRPTPGGGAIHALEIYAAVRQCDGLDAGLYRYCPLQHGFYHYDTPSSSLGALLDDYEAYVTGGVQVLLLITARFPRMFWKYRTIGYATLLKDTGALFQSLYLVATAMGLAPCAMGSGDSRALSRFIEVDPHMEATIGEFLIGSKST